MASFDVVSKVSSQEITNALNQSNKEIQTRYDFKSSKSEISFNQKDNYITILADDDLKLRSVVDIFKGKLLRRKLPLKAFSYKSPESASGGMLRQRVDIQSGISKDKAREMLKFIKGLKFKVQTQIQEDSLRVTGKSKNDLQSVIASLKEKDFGIHIDFTNYR